MAGNKTEDANQKKLGGNKNKDHTDGAQGTEAEKLNKTQLVNTRTALGSRH